MHNARASVPWAHEEGGGDLCSRPIASAETPHPPPALPPDAGSKAPHTSEQSLAVFKDVTKNQAHPMSFAAFENAFFFKSSPSSSIWPVGPGAQNRVESMRAGGGGGQEVHSYQQRRGESSSVPGSLLSEVKLLADRAGQVNAACFAITGGH